MSELAIYIQLNGRCSVLMPPYSLPEGFGLMGLIKTWGVVLGGILGSKNLYRHVYLTITDIKKVYFMYVYACMYVFTLCVYACTYAYPSIVLT
jgi:hypothetical protein